MNAAWADFALCAQTDPELWFPAKGRNDQIRAAKAVCGRCPVRAECLDQAMTLRVLDDRTGIWGGLSPYQRRALARRTPVAA